jgi:hypothetical protein
MGIHGATARGGQARRLNVLASTFNPKSEIRNPKSNGTAPSLSRLGYGTAATTRGGAL